MAAYLVLARKYRSTTFEEIVGQEPIAQTLKNAVSSGRIAQAYLFTGTRGVGKTTAARILAKALNCLSTDQPTPQPCNKCDACRAIGAGDDIDVVEIDGASNRGIDEIRQLRANAILRPSRSRYKIYYIDEVHMLTKEAFNALLKTLEEPPAHVKFIFATTETEKVPATILSRCQRFDFRNIPTRQIAEHLTNICKSEGMNADQDALFRIARAGNGSMRDALSLLDQLLSGSSSVTDAEVVRILGTPSDERTLAIAQAVATGNAAAALEETSAVLESGVALTSLVGAMSDIFRNMMLCQACGADTKLIELPDTQRQALAQLAKGFSLPALVQAVGIVQATARNLRGSSVGRALVEAMLVRLAAADQFVDPQSLVERLEALAAGGVAQKKNLTPNNLSGASGSGGGSGPASRFYQSPSPKPAGSPPISSAAVPAATDDPQTSPQAQAAPALQWDSAWLASNWSGVIEALGTGKQMQVAGLLRMATVAGFDGAMLKLNFDAQNESLRQRCEAQSGVIAEALAALAGRPIRCEFTCSAAGNGAAPARAFGGLSTAEKAEVVKDPAVQAVLSLFGGDVADVRHQQPTGRLAVPREEELLDENGPEA